MLDALLRFSTTKCSYKDTVCNYPYHWYTLNVTTLPE